MGGEGGEGRVEGKIFRAATIYYGRSAHINSQIHVKPHFIFCVRFTSQGAFWILFHVHVCLCFVDFSLAFHLTHFSVAAFFDPTILFPTMSEGITDPSDWPIEFKSLREIDSHLRCPICKELLRAAVVLQCSHNFCSECIRRHLDKESSCPACRVATSTSQMRRNIALDQIANNFGDCR